MRSIHRFLIKTTTTLLILLFSTALLASVQKIPEPFTGSDENSKYDINYLDLDAILKTSVLTTGRSTRAKAKKSTANIGTRLKTNINRLTALEGNRFYFESYKEDEYKALISNIRASLSKVPSQVPLNHFSNRQQLAYWLNLYNITLLDELIKIYPQRKLKDIYDDGDILDRKSLSVAGINLSLNDIQYNILAQKYDHDPLIIYGLYQGIVGGPNIRKRAFSAENVYEELASNAKEFINSNRGTYSDNKGVFRVSSLYERNSNFFPNFKSDLTAHLLKYLDRNMSNQLKAAKKIKANINDWNITDVYGTTRSFGGGAATNSAGLLNPGGEPERTGTQTHFDGEQMTFRAVGNRPGGDAGNAGFHNTTSTSMADLTGQHGQFSAEQLKRLRELNALRLERLETSITITDLPRVTSTDSNN